MFLKRVSPLHRPGLGILFSMILASTGCGVQRTPIKSLLDDPAHYDGEMVRVSGEVKENVGVMGYGAYRVDDGTGTMTIFTRDGGAPREGVKVTVKGTFRSGFTLGSSSLAVIEEQDRKPEE